MALHTARDAGPGPGGRSIRTLLVDDQPLLRTGFRMILDAEDGIEVVGEAADGQVGLEQARLLRPDVVLMDIRMPRMDGVEATRRIVADPDIDARVLVLTTFDLDDYVVEALRAGASAFLLKDAPADDLVAAIRIVAQGDAVVAPSVTRRLLDRFSASLPSRESAPPPRALASLTEREHDVLKLVARGLSNAEIAAELFVSETTVKTHVGHLLTKLELRDRVQACVFAYESGVVRPGLQ